MSDDVRMKRERYFLKYDNAREIEVSREEYVAAERACGIHGKPGEEHLPSGSTFAKSDRYGSTSGRVLTL